MREPRAPNGKMGDPSLDAHLVDFFGMSVAMDVAGLDRRE